jgi:hypothetical protein
VGLVRERERGEEKERDMSGKGSARVGGWRPPFLHPLPLPFFSPPSGGTDRTCACPRAGRVRTRARAAGPRDAAAAVRAGARLWDGEEWDGEERRGENQNLQEVRYAASASPSLSLSL